MSSQGGEGATDAGAADFFGNERFELEECLGEGAYGIVYQAYDRLRDTHVALKVLRRLGPDALFYFKREFRALADIEHPNLVRYHELFEERGRWFLTMELVRGQSFVEYVRAGRSVFDRSAPCFDESRLRAAVAQLVSALSSLHAAGKVHRDIKPSNVRVTEAGRVVLLDFGLVLDTDARESARLPRVGTATFMAPEQIIGAHVGPAADFYAVGSVLYECLTGRHPFVGDPFQVMADKQTRDALRPSDVALFVPLDLDELCVALLAREPRERASGIEVLRELSPRSVTTAVAGRSLSPAQPGGSFVGRARELSALIRLLGALEDGGPRIAFLHGESGVGKSALLTELARRVGQELPDSVLLSGRCYEREAVPFKAFDGVIDALARHLRRLSSETLVSLLPPHTELLPQVFPVLARVPEIRERAAREKAKLDAPAARRRAFVALKALFARLAETAPLVIAIDDIHWADVDSMSLLEELLTPADLPVLFVLSGRARVRRDDSVPETLDRLLQQTPHSLRLRLGALAEADARALADGLLAESGGPRALADAIAREAAGQPLFVSTLVRFVSERAVERIPTLDEALSAHVTALSEQARLVVAMLAVAGAPLTRDVLARATALDPLMLSSAIDEALSTRWVKARGAEGGNELELSHERVREAVLSCLREGERQRHHLRLAEALSRTGKDPEAAALHWAEAGAHAEVTTYARRAARSAVESLAFARAIRLYELALLHVAADETAQRREIVLELAEALSLSGRSRDAAQAYANAATESEGAAALELRYRASSEWLSAGDYEQGLREAEAILGELSVQLPRARGELVRSLTVRRVASFLRGYRWETKPSEQAEPGARLLVDVLWSLTTALSISDPLRGAEMQTRHLAAALALGDPYRGARAFALQAWFVRAAFQGADLLDCEELRHARELASSSAHPHALALVEIVESVAHYLLGRYRDATRLSETAERRLREECRSVAWEIANTQLLELTCRLDTGQWRSLAERVPRALAEAQDRGDRVSVLGLGTRFSYWERLLSDEAESARQVLDDAHELLSDETWGVHRFNVLCAHTEIDLYLGDPNAFARVDRAWRDIERSYLLRSQAVRTRAFWVRARAALGSAYLMPHQRPRLLALALRAADRLGRERSESARALALLTDACAADVAGERERAVSLLGNAALACEACHTPQYAAAARRRQGALLGGEEGRAMVVRAERFLREQGAVDPGRMSALLLGY